jgi:hypothetical protein
MLAVVAAMGAGLGKVLRGVGRALRVTSLRQRCHALRLQLQQARERIRQLEAELASERGRTAAVQGQRDVLQATVRQQARKLYGRKTEQSAPPAAAQQVRRPRGQQPGRPGHGRRRYDDVEVPTVHVWHELPVEARTCACGRVAVACGEEQSTEVHYRTSVVREVHHRRRYVCTCGCAERPRHLVAAGPAQLWPRALLGPDLLAKIVTEKFWLMRPLHRIVAALGMEGLPLAEGSLVGMFWKLQPAMAPLFEAFAERNAESPYLHVDETRWRALWAIRGPKHWLWVFAGPDTTLFALAASRGHEVVVAFLGLSPDSTGARLLTLICDFMKAYDALHDMVQRARCWAHWRRLVLECLVRCPEDAELRAWVAEWITRVDALFHHWAQRDRAAADSPAWRQADAELRACAAEMAVTREEQLQRPDLPPDARRVLDLSTEHWDEMTRCVDDPNIEPSNNPAERALRNPVAGRKAFLGSGAEWAGQFFTTMLSVLTTVAQNGLNPLTFLIAYLTACAANRGQAPQDLRAFCPWSMTESERLALSRPPEAEPG